MFDFKKALLGTSAMIAVALLLGSPFSAQAATYTITSGTSGQWASTGTAAGGSLGAAQANDNVSIQTSSYTLSIISDGTAQDTSGQLHTFTVGAITNSSGTANLTISSTDGDNTTTISSLDISGALTSTNSSGAGNAVATTVSGTTDVGTLTITGASAAGDSVSFKSEGAFTSTGAVNVTGGSDTGATSTLTLSSTASIGGTTTVQGGSASGAVASLVVLGNSVTSGIDIQGGSVLGAAATAEFSGTLLSTGAITVTGNAALASLTVDGNFSTTGALTVTGGTASSFVVLADFGGNVTSSEDITIVGDVGNAQMSIAGNLDTSGAVSIRGGSATEAALYASGSTVSAASYTLTDESGTAQLVFERSGNQTISGAINGASASEGILYIHGSGVKTFEDSIGATGSLSLVEIANGTTLALSGNKSLSATNILLSGTSGTLRVGTGAVTATINGNGVGEGVVTFTGSNTTGGSIGATTRLNEINLTNGTLNVAHNMAADDINVTGGTLKPTASRTISGNINLSGSSTLDLGLYTVTNTNASGDLTVAGSNVTLAMTVGSTTNGKVVLAGGTGAFINSGTMTVETDMSGTAVHTGEKIVLIRGGDSSNTVVGTVNVDATALVSWDVSKATATASSRYGTNDISAGDVVMTANVHDARTVNGVSAYNAPSINGLMASSGSDVVTLMAAVQNLETGAQVNKAGAQLRPETNGALAQASFNAVGQVLNVIAGRNENIRISKSGRSGLAFGKQMGKGPSYWIQGFGSSADQGERDGIDGYQAETYGGAAGFDFRALSRVRMGLALAYAHSTVDDDGARTGSGQDINSYLGVMYASYIGSPWYIDTSMTYGFHHYKSSRYINFDGVTPATATASFDGSQFGIKGEFGYPMAMTKKSTITPFASLDVNYLDIDGYSEAGATGANLNVDGTSTYSMRSGLGAKVDAVVGKDSGWYIKPGMKAMWAHEFNDEAPDVTARYSAAGGASFVSPGSSVATEAIIFGLALDFVSSYSASTFSIKYDAEVKDAYVGHNGLVQFRSQF